MSTTGSLGSSDYELTVQLLQVQGYSSSKAARVIRTQETGLWPGAIISDRYDVNAYENHKISGRFRTKRVFRGRIFVGDTRGG